MSIIHIRQSAGCERSEESIIKVKEKMNYELLMLNYYKVTKILPRTCFDKQNIYKLLRNVAKCGYNQNFEIFCHKLKRACLLKQAL